MADLRLRVLLGGHVAGPNEHEVRPQFIGEGECPVSATDTLLELVRRVERPTRGKAEGHERELDRAQDVAKIAAARLAQPLRSQVADGLEHHAPAPIRAASWI